MPRTERPQKARPRKRPQKPKPPPEAELDEEVAEVLPKEATRTVVRLSTEEHQVVADVLRGLADDDDLFRREGALVRPCIQPAPVEQPDRKRSLRVRWPGGAASLQPASPAFVRSKITERVELVTWKQQGEQGAWVSAHPPNWLVPGVMEQPKASSPDPIRPIVGILPGPTIRPDGSLIGTVGYDSATHLFLARGCPGLSLPDRPTQEMARLCERTLWDLVEQFPWAEPADYSRWLSMLLTVAVRYMIDKVPLGLINANVAGAGKSRLCELISIISHGHDSPILMSWPEGAGPKAQVNEVRKRLASLLNESASLVTLDNLPRGEGFDSPELCAFLTATAYHDRELGYNNGRRVGGPNNAVLLATGNAVWPAGDLSDRTVVIQLDSPHSQPRALPSAHWRIPRLMQYATDNRAELLGCVLTIWRAWILAGEPGRSSGPAWGSFEEWAETVPAIIRWLDLPDPIEGRATRASENDAEASALRTILATWSDVVGDQAAGPGKVIEQVNDAAGRGGSLAVKAEAFREAILALAPRTLSWPPSAKTLGNILAAHAGRPVAEAGPNGGPLALRGVISSHTKRWEYWVHAPRS